MNPNEIYEKLTKKGHDWADKEQAANLLESSLKSFKAKIAIDYKNKGCGVAEADMRAEADQSYIEAKVAAIDARTEAIKAKVDYGAAQVWVEAWRTVEANERAANRYQT